MDNIISFFRSSFVQFSIVIFILGGVTFGGLSELGLDAYDDRDHMVDTAQIVHDWTHMFSPDRIVEIRPPIDMLFILGYLCWGENPAGYHMVEVVLHIVATLILVCAFQALGANRPTAYLSALFFFMNVAHHRAMYQITTVTYMMALIFGLLVVIFFMRFLVHRTYTWMVMALLCLAIGVFSHPSIISVVLFCCYLSWRREKSFLYLIQSVWPMGVISGVLVFLIFLASWHGDQVMGVVTQPDVGLILSKPFWYFGRLWANAHWVGPTLFEGEPVAWEVVLGALYCLVTLWLYRQKIFPAADWAVWSCVVILPFLNYPLFLMELGPSRHLYIPSAGSSFVLVWGIQQAVHRLPVSAQKLSFAGIVGILMVMSIVSLKRVEAYAYYRSGRGYIAQKNFELGERQLSKAIEIDAKLVPNDVFERLALARLPFGHAIRSFAQDALKVYPEFDNLYLVLGVSYLQEPDPLDAEASQRYIQKAFELTNNAAELKLSLARLLQGLGGYYHKEGQYEDAVRFYKEALKINPEYIVAYYNMGNAFNAMGRNSAALDAYKKAVSFQPDDTSALQNMANIHFEQGDLENALPIYQLLASNAKSSTHYYNLGVVYKRMGDLNAAEETFELARHLAPQDTDILLRLAEVLYETKDFQGTMDIYREMLSIDPRHTLAYYNFGTLLVQENRSEEAVEVFQKAVGIAPKDQEMQLALAFAYETASRIDDALELYRKVLRQDPDNEIAQRRLNLYR